ncbi:hypothetical protein HPB49_002727 [Dermacentor silvarum]|uniref:Uncharacterized protein n=1 Tax=Dermacentor silvarum TaxID=543639 RepID=A0ACB8DA13_DERSI|nr:hypothetical protein HPB49_002727 [Dermacentor silvarum]
MGKKCFVPGCHSGYASCKEPVSLFSAPKEEARLEAWRKAIPRSDRVLRSTDHVCEKHFDSCYVSKTWSAEHGGVVLASTTRRAVLSSDAVPTIFPNRTKYLSKSVKRRKRPASRKPKDTSAKKMLSEGEACQTTTREAHMETDSIPSIVSDHDTENAGSLRPGPSCSGSHGENKERDLDASVRDAEDAVCSLNDSACDDFECLFRNPSLVRLPSMYWSWSRGQLTWESTGYLFFITCKQNQLRQTSQ